MTLKFMIMAAAISSCEFPDGHRDKGRPGAGRARGADSVEIWRYVV